MRRGAGTISTKGIKAGKGGETRLAAAVVVLAWLLAVTFAADDDGDRDRAILRTLETDLEGDPAVQAHLIDIQVSDGIVDLSGRWKS